jgi:hypothetical protein
MEEQEGMPQHQHCPHAKHRRDLTKKLCFRKKTAVETPSEKQQGWNKKPQRPKSPGNVHVDLKWLIIRGIRRHC